MTYQPCLSCFLLSPTYLSTALVTAAICYHYYHDNKDSCPDLERDLRLWHHILTRSYFPECACAAKGGWLWPPRVFGIKLSAFTARYENISALDAAANDGLACSCVASFPGLSKGLGTRLVDVRASQWRAAQCPAEPRLLWCARGTWRRLSSPSTSGRDLRCGTGFSSSGMGS